MSGKDADGHRTPEYSQDSKRRARRPRRAACIAALLVAGAGVLAGAGQASARSADAASTPWPGGVWQPDPASYGMTVVSGVPVTMSDGVTLFANIGYPTDPATGKRAAGTFPVLLTQNPYAGPTEDPDPFFVDRGYIFVSVDVRGTLDSEAPGNAPLSNGLFSPRQTEDGVELVNWAAHELSGSNGVIGLTGCSQLGINQIFTAAAVGPHSPVKAIIPACASNNYGIYFAGGIPGPTVGLFDSPLAVALSGTKHSAANLAAGTAIENDIMSGGPLAYDGDYWQQRTTSPALAARIVQNGIPALLWSGYHAPDGTGSLEFYAALQNAALHRPASAPMAPHQPATGRYQVIVGPWGHGRGLDESIELEWYDTWLKGEHTRITDTRTPMHLYDNGSGNWVNAPGYPLTPAYTPYYLQGAGALAAAGLTSGSDTITWGQPAQPGTTLSYTTRPLTRGATLAGPISASIYASSSNSNLELIATLYDIAPNGTATQITTGTLLGSMRAEDPRQSWYARNGVLIQPAHPFLADDYLPAGIPARYDIKLNPTVWSLLPGHSLRLTLSTQTPAADCNSVLTALAPAIPCLLTAPQQATLPGGVYQIDHSWLFPSSLNLPLLPIGSLPVAASGTTPTSNGQTEPLQWRSNRSY
jgi:predicted acyl esterase